MIHHFEIGKLFDFYQTLLTDKQREAIDLYYNDDLTMQEISEDLGVSKQAVSLNIKNGVAKLHEFEEALKVAKVFYAMESTKSGLTRLSERLQSRSDIPSDVKNEIYAILSDLEMIE